jgi:hypothetical protein
LDVKSVSKVRACLNAIQAIQMTKVKKMHKLQLAQVEAGEKQPHTPYELYLLQHKKKLELHCHMIAAAKAIENEKEACRKHEDLFWQWMESVGHEALAIQAQSPLEQPPTIDLIGVTEAELLSAVEHLKWKSATFEPKVEGETSSSFTLNAPKDPEVEKATLSESFKRNALLVDSCPSGNSTLLLHIKEIAKCLLRQPVVEYKPKKKLQTRHIKATLRNEEKDPQSASFRIQRYARHYI